MDNTDIFVDEYLPLYHPREKFASIFAQHFLIPPTKLKQIIAQDFKKRNLNYEDIVYLKRYFGAGTLHMLQTLLKLKLLPLHKFSKFSDLDHKTYEKSLFGNLTCEEKAQKGQTITSDRYKCLGVFAYNKKITEEES